MLEPYEPHKIPVLMVHGLWSSPVTWMEMFNDLRVVPEIRNHYQFWFYLYPTGQPFWVSAGQLRRDLAAGRSKLLDPRQHVPRLDQMVLVGHSMGGLVSEAANASTAATTSGPSLSDKPFEQLKAEPELKRELRAGVFLPAEPVSSTCRNYRHAPSRQQVLERRNPVVW